MLIQRVILGVALVGVGGAASEAESVAQSVRMNQIQVLGTHNSYHVRPANLDFIMKVNPEAAAWDYTHPPLDEQLERGIRSFELDMYNAPGGFEVYHVPQFDAETTCRQFAECLRTIKRWSDAHPHHVPVSILLEFKLEESALAHPPVLPMDAESFERLDAVVRDTLGNSLLTPDEVRGGFATLREAVTTEGWPALDSVRGRVFLVLHDQGDLRNTYTAGRPSLEGRALFVRSRPDRPDAATLIMDNPRDEAIPERVREGFWVRTRVDSGLRGSEERRESAFASGAHVLTSDYPPGAAHPESGYVVAFEGNAAARCNPVNCGELCPAQLE